MKIINESKKEKLPIDFITQFVSKGWDEVGMLKASKDAIKTTFKETAKVESIIQDLIDSYLVCIGQMELYLDKKDYLAIPEASELNEATNTDEDLKLQEDLELKNSGDFDVEVKQEDNKVKIEIEPKEEEPEKEAEEEEEEQETEEETEDKEVAKQDAFEYFLDFAEPTPDDEADQAIQDWLSMHNN